MKIVRQIHVPYSTEHAGYVLPYGHEVIDFAEVAPQESAIVTTVEFVAEDEA